MTDTDTTETVFYIQASRVADHDDCLYAATAIVCDAEGVEVWQCAASWLDSDRETILVQVAL